MHRYIRPVTVVLTAVLAFTAIPLSASVAQTKSIRVHSYDLDLATAAGQTEMKHRIQRAVDQVCGPAAGRGMDDIMARASCSNTAQATAMTQYDAMVSAAKTGKVATNQNGDLIVR
jgi:UrcA family protein